MPEIKNTFVQGKMNKDLDERLLPNGQYRDAMNIQVATSEGANVGTVQNVLGNELRGGITGDCVGSIADEKNNKLYWFVRSNINAIYEYTEGQNPIPVFIDYHNVLEFGDRIITGINIVDDFLFWTDGFNEPKKINITRSKLGTINDTTHTKLVVNNAIVQDANGNVDIQKEHITVIKKKPTSKLNVEIITSSAITKPSLFEKTLSRLSYRYKYEDGEYSAFGPFTDVIFQPLYPTGINQSNYFTSKEPYNLTMLNSIESLNVYDFVAPDTPKDVVQVDILYKQENSPVVYSITSIKKDSNYWNDYGYRQGEPTTSNSSKYSGKYSVTSENIYAAVPENQLLRIYDNVPRSALAQEITGSRLVYGNYIQNYDISDKPEIYVDYGNRLNYIPSVSQEFYTFPANVLKSIKSQRNYQLGIVFGDKYGRETPVFSSTESAVKIPWESGSVKSASQSHQLKAYVSSNIPTWADYYKFYIKQTSSEYYNLVMDKAYTPTEDVDKEEREHLWISFNSSDRNKVNEEDYLIIKKKLDSATQFSTENRFKILGIVNEAPDAIKFKYKILGQHDNKTTGDYDGVLDGNPIGTSLTHDASLDPKGLYTAYQSANSQKPLRFDITGCDTIVLDKKNFEDLDNGGASLISTDTRHNEIKDLYISWFKTENSNVYKSRRYRIASIMVDSDSSAFGLPSMSDAVYIIKLENQVNATDADIAKHATDTGSHPRLNENLTVTIERKDLKDMDQFSGRFFVKIVSDPKSDELQQQPGTESLITYTVEEQASSYWFADNPLTTNSKLQDTTLTHTLPASGSNNLAIEIAGTTNSVDNYVHWGNLLDHAILNGNRFFIDNLLFRAGQNDPSNSYAKNSGEVLAGARWTYGQITWSNTIDADKKMPPTKVLSSSSDYYAVEDPEYWEDDLRKNYWPRVLSAQLDSNASTVWQGNNTRWEHIVRVWTSGLNINSHDGAWDDYEERYSDEFDGNDGEDTFSPYYLTREKATSRWKPYAKDSSLGWYYEDTLIVDQQPNINGWLAIPQDPGDVALLQSTNWSPMFSITPGAIDPFWSTTHGTTHSIGGTPNCMEGIVVTDDVHTSSDPAIGRRRWRQEGDITTSNSFPSDVYGATGGKVFMHLSFLGPGKDLVPDPLDLTGVKATGYNSVAKKLQGIWGGGVFVPDSYLGNNTLLNDVDATKGSDNFVVEMEGNYVQSSGDDRVDSDFYTEPIAPGPGVGQGYDLAYQELHEKQWDIDFPSTTESQANARFADRLKVPGTQFRFSADPDGIVYTINACNVKRLYNHTSWRKRYDWGTNNAQAANFINTASVEKGAIDWAKDIGTAAEAGSAAFFKSAIQRFGKADNRRLVFILELDKDPTDAAVSPNFNPCDAANGLTANIASEIQIVTSGSYNLLGEISSIPTIFETEPKSDSGLDVYYEASGAVPSRINADNNEIFAPIGCKVEIVNADGTLFGLARTSINYITEDIILNKWSDTNPLQVFFTNRVGDAGFNRFDNQGNEIDYTNKYIRFYRVDGSYTTAQINSPEENIDYGGGTNNVINSFSILESTQNMEAGLSWYNCFSFGDGVESDRIRDDFNEMRITNGARASTTTEEPYERDHRKHGLIFSGLYNSNSSLNELNQFIMAEKITKDINPTYGSIQKLFSRQTDLITFCEDRVVKILANKDAVFNADGNPQLTANINVLGQTIPFVGDYGISQNPESFAKESYRAYFADRQRGAILRLSKDGLTPISEAGMHDWFRDNLRYADNIIGSYDAYKRNYNVTLKDAIATNLITNTDISQGVTLLETIVPDVNYSSNPTGTIFDESTMRFNLPGDGYQPWVNPSDQFVSNYMNPNLLSHVVIREYPFIGQHTFQLPVAAGTIYSGSSSESYTKFQNNWNNNANRYMAVYGGLTNGFNNVTGNPPHKHSRTLNGVDIIDTPGNSGTPNNGVDAAQATTLFNRNIFHVGQSDMTNLGMSPSGGGGTTDAEEYGYDEGIVFYSYPPYDQNITLLPTDYLSHDDYITFPKDFPNDLITISNNFFTGTYILDYTANLLTSSATGLFNTGINGAPMKPTTVFNGEVVYFKIEWFVPKWGENAQGPEDTVHGPTINVGVLPPDPNKPGSGVYKGFTIKLHDGTPAADGSSVISSDILMSATDMQTTDSTSHFDFNPYPSLTYSSGSTLTTPSETSVEDYAGYASYTRAFKFKHPNNDEVSAIAVQDLQITIHPRYTHQGGVELTDPRHHIGSMVVTKLELKKQYRLENVGTPAVIAQYDVPGLPENDVDAWTEVIIPELPAYWQSPTTSLTSYLTMTQSESYYGPSNPPTERVEDQIVQDISTGVYTITAGGLKWYEGADNGITSYRNTYSLPNYIYSPEADPNHVFNVETAPYDNIDDDTNDVYFNQGNDFIHQIGIDETINIDASSDDVTLRFAPVDNTGAQTSLQKGAWYCVDVWEDEDGLDPVVNGTWSQAATGKIYVKGVCNNNLNNGNVSGNYLNTLDWGDGGTITEQYPVGHVGRILNTGITYLSTFNPEVSIQLETYKPNIKDSTEASGNWTLAAGVDRNNIDTRTYGSWHNQGSYRAIFQLHANSAVCENNGGIPPYFDIVFSNVHIDVQKITITKIQNPTQTSNTSNEYGDVSDVVGPNLLPTISSSAPWITNDAWRGTNDGGVKMLGFRQGLQDPKVYYLKDAAYANYGGLNFDSYAYQVNYDASNNQENPGDNATWHYHFNNHATITSSYTGAQNAPTQSDDGWELSFSVNPGLNKFGIPRADIEGGFYGYVAGKSNSGSFDGFAFDNIQHVGDYKIIGNISSTQTGNPYEILIKQPGSVDYEPYNTINGLSTVGTISSVLPNISLSTNENEAQVRFGSLSSPSQAFVGAIDNIYLKDITSYFTGGSADSWSFQGFDTTDDNFIFFDDTDSSNPVITFNNAPMYTPGVLTPTNADRIQLTQAISTTASIGDNFLIEFEFNNITGGRIQGYYFNSAGKGFRFYSYPVSGLNGSGYYSRLHTIGDDDIVSGELVNTLVIYVESGVVSGSIDNIRMLTQFELLPRHLQANPDDNPDRLSPTTLSYNEDVRGWVSFKSYIPEQGLSLTKKYYTINNGNLHEHHVEGQERNRFYNTYIESSLTAVLNQEPSVVKTFNTLNYEGTQSRINQFEVDSDTGLSNIKPYNISNKTGWYVDNIRTDKQSGNIQEFIEKEGKWFNYINGNLNAPISTSEFSFQGIGTVYSIVSTTATPITGPSGLPPTAALLSPPPPITTPTGGNGGNSGNGGNGGNGSGGGGTY